MIQGAEAILWRCGAMRLREGVRSPELFASLEFVQVRVMAQDCIFLRALLAFYRDFAKPCDEVKIFIGGSPESSG
jgi:hypothetical protein